MPAVIPEEARINLIRSRILAYTGHWWILRRRLPIFTVKPANDTEEFYEAVSRYKDQIISTDIRRRYQETLAHIALRGILEARNLRSRPHPAAPSSSAANTSPAPSPPLAADAP